MVAHESSDEESLKEVSLGVAFTGKEEGGKDGEEAQQQTGILAPHKEERERIQGPLAEKMEEVGRA